MSSVWAKVDGTYKVPYSRKVIESQIAQAGGVLKSAQKFYRSEDEVKSYRRSLINGHNEGDDYVPPKPPEETTRKCVLIPLSLVKDFISSWRDDDSPPDGGGGNRPHTDPVSPTGGGSVTTSDDGSVTSYLHVDGNLSQKGNFENTDCTMVSEGVIPIIGARKVSHIEDNLQCVDLTLSAEQIKELEQVSQIELGFPHDFFKADMVKNFAYNGAFDKIKNHRYSQLT